MFLITEWFGTFLVDERGQVKDQRLFPKDPRQLAQTLQRLQQGHVLDDERSLAVRADDTLRVRELRHQALPAAQVVDNAPSLADQHDAFGYPAALRHETAMELGKREIRRAYSVRDAHVMQAVDAIDELTNQSNVLVERLREWYGLHFPEFVDRAPRNEEVAGLVSAHGTREAISEAAPQYAVEDSMGGPLGDLEREALRGFARAASTLYAAKADLEKYLDQAMPQIAPNVSALLQPVLGARMLRQAGGLRRLATLPAGTIQTLGAEKALFRHIKEGKRPPKHGYLMQHPLVHRAPRHQRGALARSLAAKVALAARADAFTGRPDLGAQLAVDFEKRAEALRDRQVRQRAARRGKATKRGDAPPPGRGFRPRGGGRR